MVFRAGGEGDYHSDSSILGDSGEPSPFEWEIDGDVLRVKLEGSDWIEGVFEFSSFYTKFTFENGGDEFEKTGSVCGVCCPFAFMIIGIPAVAGLGVITLFKRRK